MQFLIWLKDLPWIVTVRESSWVYPTIETLHGVGMGLLVGTLTIVDLRILGFLERIPFALLKKLPALILIGLTINAFSGALMFMSDGPRLVDNWIFQLKIVLILAGLANAWVVQRWVFRHASDWDQILRTPPRARLWASASLLVWYGAIVAGRVTAFLGDQ